jgi:hypothetical protein
MRWMGVVSLGLLTLVGCNNLTDSSGAVVLRVAKVQAVQGWEPQAPPADMLMSDVMTCQAFWNDNAVLSFDLIAKNPNYKDINTRTVNDVIVQRYEVRYVRSDGRNVEGVDVPYKITGGLSTLVYLKSNTLTQAAIVVVRHTAKEEAPIITLLRNGNEELINVTAAITVWGQTTSGDTVTATGYLPITFGDFGEPTSCPNVTPPV